MSTVRKLWVVVSSLALWLIGSASIADPGTRFALLISNENYLLAAPGPSPARDAKLLAESLRKDKFNVILGNDLNADDMRKLIDKFNGELTAGSTALFYFNGVGIQVQRQTFLIPVGTSIWSEADVKAHGTNIDSILADLDKKAKTKIVILDAARRNPIERRFRAFSAGLAGIDPPPGTLTVFASSPGTTTPSSSGDVSLFMNELLKRLKTPGISAENVMTETKNAVAKVTDGQEVPWVSSSLKEPFFFSGTGAQTHSPSTPSVPLRQAITRSVKDCEDCPELVVLPAGTFSMGSNDSPYTRPVHRVSIDRPFAIARTPVTFEDWNKCVASRVCNYRPSDEGWGAEKRPVINISWTDTKQYLTWLKTKTGLPYRLPSEAEWEYAARGGAQTKFYWGAAVLRQMANCKDCGGEKVTGTQPVGSYRANPFGLLDMGGNVAQWVDDCWNDTYRGAPKNGSAWASGECGLRVLRGGSFLSNANDIRPSARFRYDTEVRYYANGFRVARDIP